MELSTNYEELVFFQHHEEDGKKLVSFSNYYDSVYVKLEKLF